MLWQAFNVPLGAKWVGGLEYYNNAVHSQETSIAAFLTLFGHTTTHSICAMCLLRLFGMKSPPIPKPQIQKALVLSKSDPGSGKVSHVECIAIFLVSLDEKDVPLFTFLGARFRLTRGTLQPACSTYGGLPTVCRLEHSKPLDPFYSKLVKCCFSTSRTNSRLSFFLDAGGSLDGAILLAIR
jgi:hypothetical protein